MDDLNKAFETIRESIKDDPSEHTAALFVLQDGIATMHRIADALEQIAWNISNISIR